VIIDEPQGIKYGGVVAAPAFKGIAQNTLAYLKIQPTVATTKVVPAVKAEAIQPETESPADGDELEIPPEGAVMPNFRGMSMRQVLQVMEKRGINIRLIGSGRANEQSPPPGQSIREADKVWVRFTPSA
jgi:cell division protein FtsI (penicillin-binding protein 3)